MKKKKSGTISFIAGKVKKRIPLLILMTVANVAAAYIGVQIALQTKKVLDIAEKSFSAGALADTFWWECVLLVIFVVSTIVLRFLTAHLSQYLSMSLDRDWKKELFHILLHGRFSEVHSYHSGELVNRLSNDVSTVNQGVLTIVPGIASMLTRLIGASVVLFMLEPILTVILIGVGILLMVATSVIRKRMKKLHKDVAASNGKVNGFIQESLEKLLIVQAMDVSPKMESREGNLLSERFSLQRKQKNISILGTTGTFLAMDILRYGALIFCAAELLAGKISFGTLMATTQLVGQIEGPLNSLSSLLNSYVSMLGSGERLRELYDIENQDVEAIPEEPLYKSLAEIKGEHITFTYPGDQEPTMEDFQFSIPKNSFTAISGLSGIGKSTLLKLLLGIYPIDSGSLLLKTDSGDVPMSRATRRLFGYVPQGNLLISGTVRENLLLAAPSATEEEIREAVRISEFETVLSELPDGMETVLGESGFGISEGQAQRLSIARAILRNAPILLLDEATSSLDEETEKKVLENIKAMKDKTIIVVTHRPYAREIADQKIYFGKEE